MRLSKRNFGRKSMEGPEHHLSRKWKAGISRSSLETPNIFVARIEPDGITPAKALEVDQQIRRKANGAQPFTYCIPTCKELTIHRNSHSPLQQQQSVPMDFTMSATAQETTLIAMYQDVAIASPGLDSFLDRMAHPELLQPHELRTQLIQSRDLLEPGWEERFLPYLGSV
jgi:hypothetical protein